jgi:hypothetical protein
MWSGWSVQVDCVKAAQGSSKTYYSNVSDRADAVEAVREHIGATSGEVTIEARKPIQSTVFAAMGIAPGEVRSISPA